MYSLSFLCTCFLIILPSALAQVGTATCACYPSTYTFTFNLDHVCSDTDIKVGPGISGITCDTVGTTPGETVVDFIPVAITNGQIIELDQNISPLLITDYKPNNGIGYRTGDSIFYTSLVATDPNLSELGIPSGFQIVLNAQNQLGQFITQFVTILWTNECQTFPALNIGDNIGWTTVVSKTMSWLVTQHLWNHLTLARLDEFDVPGH